MRKIVLGMSHFISTRRFSFHKGKESFQRFFN